MRSSSSEQAKKLRRVTGDDLKQYNHILPWYRQYAPDCPVEYYGISQRIHYYCTVLLLCTAVQVRILYGCTHVLLLTVVLSLVRTFNGLD